MKGKGCVNGLIIFLTCFCFTAPVFAQEESKMPYNFSASSVDVDPHSGSASTSISIRVPQGRNGIQPRISLIYNSSLKNGILGVGWSLEFGSIIRSVKKGVPKYDGSDEFFLIQNGSSQKLVYDSASGYYRTKIEGAFMKIEKVNDYWVVTDRNNIKSYFGKDESSRISDPYDASHIFKWSIDHIEDQLGNYMEISYVKEGNNLYPGEINYTGNSNYSLSPYAKVEFEIQDRDDKSFSYLAGFRISVNKRIRSVSVYAEGNLQRKYSVDYVKSDLTGRSLLSSVTEYGSNGRTSLPAMAFTYQDKMSDLGSFRVESGCEIPDGSKFTSRRNGRNADLAVRIVDINSDGYPDIIRNYRNKEQNSQRVKQIFINKGYSKEGVKNLWGYLKYPFLGWEESTDWSLPSGIMPFLDGWPEIDREWGLRFADVNGDNYVDILYYFKDGNWEGGTIHDLVYINNKVNGWERDTNWRMPVSPDVPFVQRRSDSGYRYHEFLGAVMTDVNGDGYVDIVKSKRGFSKSHWTFLNNASKGEKGWSKDVSWAPPDNKYTNLAKGAALVDLNGDGLPDIFYLKDKVVKVFMNVGKGWEEDTSSPWIDGASVGDLTKGYTRFGDVNGDGLIDMIIAKKNYSNGSTVLMNTGSGWKKEDRWVTRSFNFEDLSTQASDLDGDGMLDFIVHNDESSNVYLNKTNGTDLLIEMGNGYGGSTQISYGASTRTDNVFLPFPIQTVKSIVVSNGRSLEIKTRYEYSKGLWVPEQKEFRGFGEVKVIDCEGNYSLMDYLQDDLFKGRLDSSGVYDKDNNLFSRAENIWDSKNISDGANFVYLKRSDNYVYDGNETGRRTASEYFYDEPEQYGNLTKKIDYGEVDLKTGSDIGTDRLIEERSYHNVDDTTRLLGVVKESVLKDVNGKKIAETMFYYDGSSSLDDEPIKGFLTKKEKWAGDGTGEINPVVEYAYDEFGNIVSTKDPMGRVSTVNYDAQYHMFPIVVKNPLGQSATSEYYGVNGIALNDGDGSSGLWGQLKSSTDVNLKTSFSVYDVFGRNTKVIGPLDSIQYPSAEVSYDYSADMKKVISRRRVEHKKAKTIDTVKIYDGLGSLIRTESKSAEGKTIISDVTWRDSRGLVKYKYLPYKKKDTSPYLAFFNIFKRVSSLTNDDNARSEIIYDAVGRPIKTINPDGTFSTMEYDDWSATAIDENGHMQKTYSDAAGRLVKKEEYLGADGRSINYPSKPYSVYSSTMYFYDGLGNLTETKDTFGNRTRMEYDALGRKISMKDPDMGMWMYRYDLNGNLITQIDAKGQEIKFSYDELNRLVNKTDNKDLNVDYVYDDNSIYNSKGKLTSVHYPNGGVDFNYDGLGRDIGSVKRINDTEYSVEKNYDAINNLIDIQYPDGMKLYYKYNDAGQVESIGNDKALFDQESSLDVGRDNEGNGFASRIKGAISDFYNGFFEPYILGVTAAYADEEIAKIIQPLNYVMADNLSVGSKFYVDRRYKIEVLPYKLQGLKYIMTKNRDKRNRRLDLIKLSLFTEAKIYIAYDARARRTPNWMNGFSDTGMVIETQDTDFNVFEKEFSRGEVMLGGNYASRARGAGSNYFVILDLGLTGNPLSVENTGLYVKKIEYNINGQIAKIRYGNEVVTTYEYDPLTLRLKRMLSEDINGGQLQDLNYAYDAVGNILTITDNVNSATQSFQYDELNRLIRAEGNYGVKNYAYDEIGNIVEKEGKTYYYGESNAGPHAVTTMDDRGVRTTYTYDEDGNMSTKQVNSSELTSYVYDTENRLKKVVKDGLKIAEYEYDGDGGRTKETKFDGYTTQINYFVGPLFERDQNGDTDYIYLGSRRIAAVNGDNVLYYHADHLGGTNVITDAYGEQKEMIEYEPFGKIARDERFGTDEETAVYQFTGKRFNEDTGLYFFESRYYDPELGRFATPDIITPSPFDSQGFNRYSYTRNNPVSLIDPSGHFWFFAAVAAVFKAASAYAIAHPIISAAVVGGVLGGANAAIAGTNVFQGIGLGVLGGTIGGAVGVGIGGLLDDGIGSFWSGVAASGMGGAAAGAATSAVLGQNSGLAALAGLAGGVIAFGGSSVWPLGAEAVAGGTSSVIQGGEFGDGARFGAIDSGLTTMMDLISPMKMLGEQDFQAGDLAYFKADSFIGVGISLFDGGAFSHEGLNVDGKNMVSATLQRVPGKNRNGVGKWEISKYANREVRIISRFRGNQRVISAALATAKLPLTYGFLPNQKVCSTTCGSAISQGTGVIWTGIGPNSQYLIFKSYGE